MYFDPEMIVGFSQVKPLKAYLISFSPGSGTAISPTTAVFPGAVMRAFMVGDTLFGLSQVTCRLLYAL